MNLKQLWIITDLKQRHHEVTLEIPKHTSYGDVDSVAPLSSRSLTPVFSTVLWINSINRAGRPCGRPLHVTFWIKFLSTRVPSQLSRTINPLTMKRDRLIFEVLLSVWSNTKKNCIWGKDKDDYDDETRSKNSWWLWIMSELHWTLRGIYSGFCYQHGHWFITLNKTGI